MTPYTAADAATGEVFVSWDERGPVYVLTPGGQLTEQFRAPVPLEPMVAMDETVEEILDLIKDVPLAKAARVELAKALGTQWQHVGTAPVRKPRAKKAGAA